VTVVAIEPVYVDRETAAQVVCLSVTTLMQLVREDKFPKPRMIAGRRVAWLVRELREWAEERPASDLPPPANTGAPKPRPSTGY